MNFNTSFLVVAIAYAIVDLGLILYYLPTAARETKLGVRQRAFARLIVTTSALYYAALIVALSLPGLTNPPDLLQTLTVNGMGAMSHLFMVIFYAAGNIIGTALSTFFADFTLRLCAKLGIK